MTDRELIQRTLAGDREAFGVLVDRHRASVFRAALAALGSHPEAEDVAQETFLVAFQKLERFRGEASFKTWLLTIAWNRALDRRRRASRWLQQLRPPRTDDPEGPPAWEAAPDPDRSPEQAVVDADLARTIRRLVRRLPAKFRDALLLQGTGEHTTEEIGRMLGIPAGTVKWRVSEARRLLRQKLSALGYGHD